VSNQRRDKQRKEKRYEYYTFKYNESCMCKSNKIKVALNINKE